ncbi:hypothetical protein ACSF3O_03135 [Acinetobacter soli]|uniref:hypothetical protein n=1 Tax=Acinetobacter soli TaxID=487316 RepID=UPI00258E95E9|nr:hypothetical protein [uncultured Acinetobacter sp.]
MTAVTLLIAILFAGYLNTSKYSEIRTLNNVIAEKQQATVEHLNRSGGSLTISTCRRPESKAQRLCIQINKSAGGWQNGYMIPMGY